MAEMKTKKQKLMIYLGILFLAVGLAGGGWWWYRSGKIINTDDARVSGTIVSVSAKISGRVTAVLVNDGDTVKAGQVLVKLDARDASVQKRQAEAALAAARSQYEAILSGARPQEIGQAEAGASQAQASVDQAYAKLDNAQKTYQRMRRLFADKAISENQMDNAEAEYAMAKEGWRAAREAAANAKQKRSLVIAGSRDEDIRAVLEKVKQAEAVLDAAELNTEYTAVVAPVDGVVASKNVNPGEVVAAGQTLFSVVDNNDLWLNARIEETKIGKVRLGQRVDYTIDGYPSNTFTGEVYEIGMATNSTFALIPTENSSGNFTKVTQRIPVKIRLPKNCPDIVFRPGMQAIIDINLQ